MNKKEMQDYLKGIQSQINFMDSLYETHKDSKYIITDIKYKLITDYNIGLVEYKNSFIK